ncbi:hypothetical protein TCAL_17253 [Tigriopus californicus]|uniref:C2H2-type domain-containing protein n=1 Tax=Tigriopus californicus TaxID=6832 RepID=A0A553NXS3_TIGCA|nr:uncharacterized protein LOC131887350 [Tigriopus californicus]TRY70217.1 hypothetical protein TCAL_17253 [Tigriopus californicus]
MGDGEFSATSCSSSSSSSTLAFQDSLAFGGAPSALHGLSHPIMTTAEPQLSDKIKNMALLTLLNNKRHGTGGVAHHGPPVTTHNPNLNILSPDQYSHRSNESPPLHFSDSPSPPPCSPPSISLAAIDPSNLFYRSVEPDLSGGFELGHGGPSTSESYPDGFQSVLTHEHSDPLLSSSAAGDVVLGPTYAVPSTSVNSGSMALLVSTQDPGTQPSMLNDYLTTQSPSHVMTTAPTANPPAPKHDKLVLFGCFRCNVNASPADSGVKQYVIHVFDQGCYFTPGPDPDYSLVISVQNSPVVNCLYSKIDPNRASHDQVTLIFQDRRVLAPKPGSASQAIQGIKAGKVFFTQVTALQRILLFFKRSYNLPWITNVIQLTETENPSVASQEDFQILHGLSRPSVLTNGHGPAGSLGSPSLLAASSSETLHFQSGTITLHASGGDSEGTLSHQSSRTTPLVSEKAVSVHTGSPATPVAASPVMAPPSSPHPVASQGILSQMLRNPPKPRQATPVRPSLPPQVQPSPLTSQQPQLQSREQTSHVTVGSLTSSTPTTPTTPTSLSTPMMTPSSITALLSKAQPVPLESLAKKQTPPHPPPVYRMPQQSIPTTNPPPYHSVVRASTPQVMATTTAAPTLTTNAVQDSMRVSADVQNVSRQYAGLTPEQSSLCISCQNCPLKFKYSIENLFHFILSNKCLQHVLGTRQDTKQAFYPAFFELMAQRCGLSSEQMFQCDSCLSVVKGPMLYCIHRDQHRPAMGDLFPCQFCGFLFRAPHAFYRHVCIRNLDPKSLLKRFAEGHLQSSALGGGRFDTFRIYSLLTQEEKTQILKCPICAKGFAYFSGLVVHIRSSGACLNGVFEQNKAQGGHNPNTNLDLTNLLLTNHGLNPRLMECELCGTKVKNQIGYAIHRDHHSLQEQGTLICKGCNQDFQSPCEFYRHNCQVGGQGPSLFWCPFCVISRHCDQLKGPKISEPSVSQNAFQPVLVSSSSSFSSVPNLPILTSASTPMVPIVQVTESTTVVTPVSTPKLEIVPVQKTSKIPQVISKTPSTPPPIKPEIRVSQDTQYTDPLEECLQRIHEGRLPSDELTPSNRTLTSQDIKGALIKLEPTPPKAKPQSSHSRPSKDKQPSRMSSSSSLATVPSLPSPPTETSTLPANFDLVFTQSNSKAPAKNARRPSKGTARRGRPRVLGQNGRGHLGPSHMANGQAPPMVARKSKPPPPSPDFVLSLPETVNGAFSSGSGVHSEVGRPLDIRHGYICMDCDPPRILRNAQSLSEHSSNPLTGRHVQISSLLKYDNLSIPIKDLTLVPKYAGFVEEAKRRRTDTPPPSFSSSNLDGKPGHSRKNQARTETQM